MRTKSKGQRLVPIKLVVLLLMSCALIQHPGSAQSDPGVLPRHSLQQRFISRALQNSSEKPEITNTDELDHLLQSMQKTWKQFVRDSLSSGKTATELEGLINLDAYSCLMTVIWATGNYELKEELKCHLFSRYMLPSLTLDFSIVKSNRDLASLKNIWPGSLSNTVSFGSMCISNPNTYDDFYRLYSELYKYLTSLRQSNPASSAQVDKLLPLLTEFKYDIETKHYFLNSQPDVALSYFITGLSVNKYQKERAVEFGKMLIEYFNSTHEWDKSLTVLSTLVLYTTNDEVARDSLAIWYHEADPKRGKALYSNLQQKVSGKQFVTSKTISIDLPQKWNFIANPVPDSQLFKVRFFLVDFWFTGCAPCIAEIPSLNKLSNALRERDDIVFISLNTDFINGKRSPAFVQNFAANHDITFPVVFDNLRTEFAKHLKVRGYPTKFILDPQGRLVTPRDGSEIKLETFLRFIEENN